MIAPPVGDDGQDKRSHTSAKAKHKGQKIKMVDIDKILHERL